MPFAYLVTRYDAGRSTAAAGEQDTPEGVEDLRYDKDGDGTFETSVAPTVSVSGAAARDLEPPVITFRERAQGSKRLVTIAAADSGSVAKSVRYSLDGRYFQPYIRPLVVDPMQNPVIYAFADDGVANRSVRVTYKPLVLSASATRDARTGEIIVTGGVRNEGTAAVITNFVLDTATLNRKPTTTMLPVTISTVAAAETATVLLRFPADPGRPL
ncbi:MAG: hypothetical protein H0T92_06825 [Pyrinomonadaceae bacterium]|nr:hypothetical protein [Pyrinomonadaceae bacterium]